MIKDITEYFPTDVDGKPYATLSQATVALQDMAEKTITTKVKIDGQIIPDFSKDWMVKFQGEKYIMPMRLPQGAKESTSFNSTIDLVFQHWAVYQLKRWYFFTVQPVSTGTAVPDKYIATVNLSLKNLCTLFDKVLKYYYGDTITIKLNPDWVSSEPVNVEIKHSYIWDVLIKLYELYAVHWVIEPNGDADHYVIKVGYPTTEISHIFKTGFEGGLLSVKRQVQDDNIRNMLIGRGGSKNLPLRYFKKHDKQNASFSPDPDWIPELANTPFMELYGATFRSYIQGWKAKRIADYRTEYPNEDWTVTTPTADRAYAPWAWEKGYADAASIPPKFNPVEYVADEIVTVPQVGDRYVDISPNYKPAVRGGSSIDKYGPLQGGLENNEDIYPTIQDIVANNGLGRIDEVIYVEKITNDDVQSSAESEALISNLGGVTASKPELKGKERATITLRGEQFTVEAGQYANFISGGVVVKYGSLKNIENGEHPDSIKIVLEGEKPAGGDEGVLVEDYSEYVCDALTGERRSASGIPEGVYYFEVEVTVYNKSDKTFAVVVSCEHPKTVDSDGSKTWGRTFDVLVKNIWGSRFGYDERGFPIEETPEEYAKRIWEPILGDKIGTDAKIVFSDGELSLSQDYEFIITSIPKFEVSQCEWTTIEDGVITKHNYQSEWRITLAKSDADLESTGLYVPSAKRRAKAGDHFFFVGIDMPHLYVIKAEERLDDWKKDELAKVSETKPELVVELGPVRIHNYGKAGALVDELRVGRKLTVWDKRFIPGSHQETRYIQSITYTYREATDRDAALLPGVKIVLSDRYGTSSGDPVSELSGEVSAIQKQIGSISNVEQIVRAVGDRCYLRKDGMPDRSMSPTEYAGLLTSLGFRSGIVGGAGWGFFRDENGAWVLEVDRVNIRREMSVNSIVVNQLTARGGMIVETAAALELTRVDKIRMKGYVCYFDQHDGSVANLFKVGDIAWCSRFTSKNGELKYYKRRVAEVNERSVTLADGNIMFGIGNGIFAPCVDGSGIPAPGDVIVQWGSYTDPERRYAKVRDVIGGGYERYVEDLDSVTAEGVEYYFVGRQAGAYDGRARFFIGDNDGYIEYRNGVFNIKGRINSLSTIDGSPLKEWMNSEVNIGGVNLLRNTNSGTRNWSGSYSAGGLFRIEKDEATGGLRAINGTTEISPQWQQLRYSLESGKISPGDYVLTFMARTTQGEARLTTAIQNGTGTSRLSNTKTATAGPEAHLCTARLTVSQTPDPNEKYYVSLYISADTVWDRLEIWDMMLERGAAATQWSPAPEDIDYIKSALREAGAMEGGLILGSYIQTGYTDDSGTYHVRSGMSGIPDNSLDGEGTALWAGGENSDLGDPNRDTGKDPAKFLIRMNGTGYASGKVIEFNDDHIKVGDNVKLTERGLVLLDNGGNERAIITNDSLPTNIADSFQSNIPITLSAEEPVTIAAYTPPTVILPMAVTNSTQSSTGDLSTGSGTIEGNEYPTPPARNYLVVKKGFSKTAWSGRIPMGSRVNISVKVIVHTGTVVNLKGTVNVKFMRGATIVAEKIGEYKYMELGKYGVDIAISGVFVDAEANYTVQIEAISAGVGETLGERSASVEIDGAASLPLSPKTQLALDGFATSWNNGTVLVARAGEIVGRVGNFGLRIDTQGIYRMNDGATWQKWS